MLTDDEFRTLADLESDPYDRAEALIAWRHAKAMHQANEQSRKWAERISLVHLEQVLGQEIDF